MKKKWIINAPVMKVALRKSAVHVQHVLYKNIVAKIIGNIIEGDKQRQQANSSHSDYLCDTKKQSSRIHNISINLRNILPIPLLHKTIKSQ